MPQLDLTTLSTQLFWLFVTFGILYIIVSKVSLPSIANVLQTRQERIINDLDKAENMKLDAENLEKEYENSLISSRAKAGAVTAEAKSRVSSVAAKKHTELDEVLATKFAEASGKIEIARNDALKELVSISSDLSRIITDSVAGIKVNAKDADDTVKSIYKTNNG